MTSQAVASAAALSQNPQALPPPMQLNILAKPPTASTSDWRYLPSSICENGQSLVLLQPILTCLSFYLLDLLLPAVSNKVSEPDHVQIEVSAKSFW